MMDKNLLNRFSSRVNVPEDWIENLKKCWIWIANTDRDGYGRISSKGVQYKAHRISWEIYNGPIPDELLVLHKCDNPPCVNPNHLFLGTHKDNSVDMVNKGRSNHSLGSTNPRAILSECDVLEILTSIENETITSIHQIINKYKVSKSTIFQIFDGRSWQCTVKDYYTFDQLKYLKNKIDTRGVLKFNDVIDIRIRIARGETVTAVAYLYGVSYNTINSIKLNRSWKNVE
jgi:hypothetical protein